MTEPVRYTEREQSGPWVIVEREYTYAQLRDIFGENGLVPTLLNRLEQAEAENAALREQVAAAHAALEGKT